jgi:hypothetical protein
MLSWSWRSIKLLLLHLVGFHIYFTYIDDARSNTNQVYIILSLSRSSTWSVSKIFPPKVTHEFLFLADLRYIRYGINLYHVIFSWFNGVFLRLFEVSISNRRSQPANTKNLHSCTVRFFQATEILKLALTTSFHTRSYYIHSHRVIWTYAIYNSHRRKHDTSISASKFRLITSQTSLCVSCCLFAKYILHPPSHTCCYLPISTVSNNKAYLPFKY